MQDCSYIFVSYCMHGDIKVIMAVNVQGGYVWVFLIGIEGIARNRGGLDARTTIPGGGVCFFEE